MKARNIIILVALFLAQISFAQIKVDKYGRIGIGTNMPDPAFKCHIKGNLLLTNYPAIPAVDIRMKIDQNNVATLGASTDRLLFWTDSSGYNNLYGTRFYNLSDSSVLDNIQPISHGINTVMKLKSYSFSYNEDKEDINQLNDKKDINSFGFLANEVELFLPEIVDNEMEVKMIDYSAIIPILTEAIKEQQTQIEALQSTVNAQMQDLIDLRQKYDKHYPSRKERRANRKKSE